MPSPPVAFAIVVEIGGYALGQWVLFAFAVVSLLAMEVLAIWYDRRRSLNAERPEEST